MAKKKHGENENENDQTLVMPAVAVPDEHAGDGNHGATEPPPGDAGLQAAPEPADEGIVEQAPLVAVIELSGPGDGHVTLIAGGAGEIGRLAPELSVRIPYDLLVSRSHARLSYRRGAWTLEDLHSSNGTWLDNGRTRVRQPVTIAPGQVFRVGHTDLVLTDDPDVILSHGEPL